MDAFDLPVSYKGAELTFPTRLITTGFAPRFIVFVDETEVIFERDDAGEFRALLPNAADFTGKLPPHDLLEAIHASIVAITS